MPETENITHALDSDRQFQDELLNQLRLLNSSLEVMCEELRGVQNFLKEIDYNIQIKF